MPNLAIRNNVRNDQDSHLEWVLVKFVSNIKTKSQLKSKRLHVIINFYHLEKEPMLKWSNVSSTVLTKITWKNLFLLLYMRLDGFRMPFSRRPCLKMIPPIPKLHELKRLRCLRWLWLMTMSLLNRLSPFFNIMVHWSGTSWCLTSFLSTISLLNLGSSTMLPPNHRSISLV